MSTKWTELWNYGLKTVHLSISFLTIVVQSWQNKNYKNEKFPFWIAVILYTNVSNNLALGLSYTV